MESHSGNISNLLVTDIVLVRFIRRIDVRSIRSSEYKMRVRIKPYLFLHK